MSKYPKTRRACLSLEHLEDRTVLAVASATLLDGGVLHVLGDSQRSVIGISQSGSQIVLYDWANGFYERFDAAAVQMVLFEGGESADRVVTNVPWLPLVAYGMGGDDYLQGHDATDVLDGGEGDDQILGYGGDDVLSGGEGNDILTGNRGNDIVFGDGGDDTLTGDLGNDELYGGDGWDYLYGGDNDDLLYGGDGWDNLFGGAGNDVLVGEAGNDLLRAGEGNDYLEGGDGDDYLYGDRGLDILLGEAGKDQLDGGCDDDYDVMWGGEGVDTFFVEMTYNPMYWRMEPVDGVGDSYEVDNFYIKFDNGDQWV